jgi:hypothetical protein
VAEPARLPGSGIYRGNAIQDRERRRETNRRLRSGGKYSFESRLDPYFAGFLLLNWLALTASVVLFLRLTQNKSPFSAAALFPIAVLVANGVTKGFFWTPHLQILNVLIPLIALHVAISVRRNESSSLIRHFLSIGILCGIASLLYGAFVLVIATATVVLVIRPGIISLRQKAVAVSVGWLAFALPLLAWRTYVVQRTGHFYMHETAAYHEFVWIFETAGSGFPQFLSALQENAAKFVRTLLVVLTLPVAILIALAFYRRSRSLPVSDRLQRDLLPAAAAFFIVAIPFFFLMGFYAARLTWQLVPPLLVVISAALMGILGIIGPRARTIASVMLVLASVVYVHHVVVSDQTVYLATGR